MAGNTFGKIVQLTTFGESHGKAIGGILQGFPAGLFIDEEFIQEELDKRRPGQSELTTQRNEPDKVEILSGVFENTSLGTPIGFIIRNRDQNSKDYSELKDIYRPSHADYTYMGKYGIRDYRGGGRSSARETACRVVAGAIAKLFLAKYGIEIHSYVSSVGNISMENEEKADLQQIFKNEIRCPDAKKAKEMAALIKKMKNEGDSVGGIISGLIKNCPIGLGEPVFDKLHAELGKAMLSINAVKGFEYGSGFASAKMKGSAHNDEFIFENEKVSTKTNFSGGVQGGISNGNTIDFRVAFKPVATISKKQKSINTNNKEVDLQAKGRHDPCVLPRAVPIVSAMAALVIADNLLLSKINQVS